MPGVFVMLVVDIGAQVQLGKAPVPGTEGNPRKLKRSIHSGTIPIHAEPWNVSGCNPSGKKGATVAAGTRQCAKRRSFQR